MPPDIFYCQIQLLQKMQQLNPDSILHPRTHSLYVLKWSICFSETVLPSGRQSAYRIIA